MPLYHWAALPYFNVLMNIGCRIEEVTNCNLWNIQDPSHPELQTVKRGGIRYFDNNEIPINYINNIRAGKQRGYFYSASAIRRIYNQLVVYRDIKVKSKDISIHLFRHRYIKQLYANGETITSIARALGYVDEETAKYYVDSIIYLP